MIVFHYQTSGKMKSRWLIAVFGLALLQGSVAISPAYTPDVVADEDWDFFSVQLRDPAYRLPTTTLPRHYEVSLTPYFDNVTAGITPFSFDGNVVIYLSPTEANVSDIVMHCHDLVISSFSLSTIVNGIETNVTTNGVIPTCEMPYAFMRITPTAVLNLGQEYIVRMSFTGNLQTDMRGFYRSWYFDSIGFRWMATTQFQPGHARKAFPCYDEPGFKATFDITINREADFSPTISNTPIRTTVTLANGRIAETFHTTPKTSTYLVAFIVSHYSRVATTTSLTRPFDIYARDNAGITGDFALEIGELLLEAMETYTNISYYGMAENLDMKQAAIPDFSAGAMENWGLLTYREALILYDPINSNHFYRQRVANIISHEITHMWFGNLVTCAWWDNLWLNEGFARLYQHYLTHMVAPEMGFDIRFIVEQLQVVLVSDSIDTAHALTNDVWDPVTVSAHFSTITYAKGASVIRMTEHLLGESTYLAGLRSYLNERQFDVAEPQHLFDALDAAAAADGALSAYPGITINEYFKTWSEKAGHPLLTVNVDHSTGLMTVVQARWERTTGQSQFPSLWQIPITWTRGGAPDFLNLKPSQVLTEQVTVINRGTVGLEWVIFNKQESGFYRVNYDDNTWALITRALRGTQRSSIHEINKAQIVDDVFALSRASVMSYRKALNILSFLEFEDDYAPWYSAITGFNWVIRRLAHDDTNLQRLKNEIIRLSVAVTNRLGYAEVANETYMDGLLRMYLMEFLCDIGHPQCVQAGVSNFQNWLNGTFIPANMRSWVYCEGLRAGNTPEYTALWNHFVQEDLSSETTMILSVLGCTRNTTHLWDYLDQIVTDNYHVRPQDFTTALNGAVSRNEANTMAVFEWLQSNVNATTAAFGSISTPLSYITARLLNEQQIAQVQTWLDANVNLIGTAAYNTGVNGIQATRNNLQWSAGRLPELVQYFNEGFVDFVEELEVETEPTPEVITTTTTTPGPTTVPDSANISVLSVFMLIAALCANLL